MAGKLREELWPYNSQPQDLPEVNWQDPLTTGLIGYVIPAGVSVGGVLRKAQEYPGFTSLQRTGPAGRYVSVTSPTHSNGALDSSTLTLVTRMYLAADPNAYPGVGISYYVSGSDRFQFGVVWNDGVNKLAPCATSNSASINTGDVSATISTPYDEHLMVTVNAWGALNLYRDASATAAASSTAAGSYVADTRKLIDVGAATPCAYAYFYNRVLTNAEDAAIKADPYRLFVKKIWVPVTAGGGSYTVTADAGAYTLSGQDAALVKTRIVTADAGSYALGGQDASVLVGHLVTADAGAYSLAGQDATLLKSKVVTADAGAYTIAGQDASLDYVPTGSTYTLTCDAGAYALAGQAASLLLARVMSADAGAYSISGQDATVSWSGEPAAVTDTSGGWPMPPKRKKKRTDDELTPEVVEAVAEVPKARRTITLQELIGKKAAAQVDAAELSQAIRTLRMRKRQREDDELMMM